MTALKSSVEVSPSGSAVRLLDHATGRFLDLSEQEGTVVALYDGTGTFDALATRAQAEGVPMNAAEVEAILERVRNAGFLAAAPGADEPAREPAQPLLPSDRVPTFRGDLKVIRKGPAGGLMEVFDPQRERAFTLYDFELSIANMLNGQRSGEEVIAAAARIGIPVTLDSLGKFIRQLRAYGFIAAGDAPPGEENAASRPSRTAWTPEVRQFFQSALRHFRAGKLEEAMGHLDALLQLDAQNEEALELKERIGKQLEGTHALALLFDDLHGGHDRAGQARLDMDGEEPPAPTTRELLDASAEMGDLEDHAAADLPDGSDAVTALDAPATRVKTEVPPNPRVAPAVTASDEPVAPPKKGRAVPALVGLGVAAAVLFPVPTVSRIPCDVGPRVVAEVSAQRDGRVAAFRARDGEAVNDGQVVAELSADALTEKKRALQEEVTAAQEELEATRSAVGPAGDRARMAVEKAQKDLDKALAVMARLEADAEQVKSARAAVLRARADAAEKAAAAEAARKARDPGAGTLQASADAASAAARRAEVKFRRFSRALKRINAAQKGVDRAQAAAEKARAGFDRVTRAAETAELREQVRALQEELANVERGLEAGAVKANGTGTFRARVAVGAEVVSGGVVGELHQPDSVAVRVAPEAAGNGLADAVLVLPDGSRHPARFSVSRVVDASPAAPRHLELVLDGAGTPAGLHGPGALEMPGPRRPWWWSVVGG